MFRAGCHLATDGSYPLLYAGLDLTDIIAGQAEFLGSFFNCVLFLHIKAINVTITLRQGGLVQHMLNGGLENRPAPVFFDLP